MDSFESDGSFDSDKTDSDKGQKTTEKPRDKWEILAEPKGTYFNIRKEYEKFRNENSKNKQGRLNSSVSTESLASKKLSHSVESSRNL